MQPISAQEKLMLPWRVSLTMPTDEADAALDHQRNGFTGVLKQEEKKLLPIEEGKAGDWCGK